MYRQAGTKTALSKEVVCSNPAKYADCTKISQDGSTNLEELKVECLNLARYADRTKKFHVWTDQMMCPKYGQTATICLARYR